MSVNAHKITRTYKVYILAAVMCVTFPASYRPAS